MEYYTAPGQGYVILTAGGTITSPDGTFSLTLDAGQTYFRATTDKIIVTDASATLCPVANWPGMQPIFVSILGKGTVSGDVPESSDIPASYIACSFLEAPEYAAARASLYEGPYIAIQIDLSDSDDFSIKTEHRVLIKDVSFAEGCNISLHGQYQWLFYGRLGSGKFYMGVDKKTFAADYIVTSDTLQWEVVKRNDVLEGKCEGATLTSTATTPKGAYELGLFAALGHKDNSNTKTYPFPGKKYSWQFEKNGELLHDLLPAITPDGVPCMYDKVTKQPFTNAGLGPFICGMTAAQARRLGELPEGGGTLTISLPSDVVDENGVLQDEAIFTALSTAVAKGWNFILQTHDGTAVSTHWPLGYMECEFLYGNGYQHIDTKYIPDADWGVELCATLGAPGGSMGRYFLGTQNVAKQTRCYLMYPWMAGWGTREYPSPHGNSNPITQSYIRLNFENSGIYELAGSSVAIPRLDFVPLYHVFLFRISFKGNQTTDASMPMFMFSCRFSHESNVVRDFVPVVNPSGEPGMFDKITQTFFANDGTGSFIVGMTAAQAVQLANLPEDATDKNITVSLPQAILNDAGEITDAAVNAALNKAADNGWDITLQYHTEQ